MRALIGQYERTEEMIVIGLIQSAKTGTDAKKGRYGK